jgi:F-type H+-transporting ATPase subunit b
MTELFTPHVGLMVWTIVTFALLVFVLGRFGWGPLIEALKEREDGIRKAIEDAASARQTADHLKAQYELELAKAQDKATAMLSQAQAEARKLREQMMKDAEADARRLMEQTKSQLEEEKKKLSRELKADVAGLSVQVAEKLLRHTMNAKEQENLVAGFMKDLEKESHSN